MSAGKTDVDIIWSNVFKKAYKKSSATIQDKIDDEIERIIEQPDPDMGEQRGEQKKGDLNYLWVHKFKLNGQLTLLGYSWNAAGHLTLYLLSIGSHENFYDNVKARRGADTNLITKKL
jgi:mRNA-degrading endonuclease RelE of RelBE toxin-antitoxin system